MVWDLVAVSHHRTSQSSDHPGPLRRLEVCMATSPEGSTTESQQEFFLGGFWAPSSDFLGSLRIFCKVK